MDTLDCVASAGCIVKEGYLSTGNDKKPSLLSAMKSKPKYWWVLKQEKDAEFACYKDETKTKLKERIQFTNTEVEVDKQEYDNYVCIKRGKQVTFLRAANRQQRDEWYSAMVGVLGATEDAGHDTELMRRRADTETTSNRPPIRRRRNQEDPQTTGGIYPAFKKELNNIASRSLPPIPSEENDDIATSKIRPPYCCVRNHLITFSKQGTNMALKDIVYQNIHFVRSEKEWVDEVESRRRNLGNSTEMYGDFNAVLYMQHPHDDHTYETRLFNREPQEHDERECLRVTNDLNQDAPQQPVDFNPNVTEEDDSRRSSVESNTDNTEVNPPPPARPPPPTAARPPPPLPTPVGRALQRKIERTKQEQMHVYGVSKTFPKNCVLGDKISLMELNDGIWVIGWDHSETRLRGALKVGDQLIKINKQVLTSVSYARDTIRSTDENEVTMVLRCIPHGTVCSIRRDSPRDDLGFQLERNEIISVDPHGLASVRGGLKPQTTGLSGCLCNWAITEINTQPLDLFASADDVMKLLRQAKEEVVLIVQPVDFIQMMRDNLRCEPKSAL